MADSTQQPEEQPEGQPTGGQPHNLPAGFTRHGTGPEGQDGGLSGGCMPHSCKHRYNATEEEVQQILDAHTRPISSKSIAVRVAHARDCEFPRTNLDRRHVTDALRALIDRDPQAITCAPGEPDMYRKAFGIEPPHYEPLNYLREETYWLRSDIAAQLRAVAEDERAAAAVAASASDAANDALEALGLPRAASADVSLVSVKLPPGQMEGLLAAATRSTGGAWITSYTDGTDGTDGAAETGTGGTAAGKAGDSE